MERSLARCDRLDNTQRHEKDTVKNQNNEKTKKKRLFPLYNLHPAQLAMKNKINTRQILCLFFFPHPTPFLLLFLFSFVCVVLTFCELQQQGTVSIADYIEVVLIYTQFPSFFFSLQNLIAFFCFGLAGNHKSRTLEVILFSGRFLLLEEINGFYFFFFVIYYFTILRIIQRRKKTRTITWPGNFLFRHPFIAALFSLSRVCVCVLVARRARKKSHKD